MIKPGSHTAEFGGEEHIFRLSYQELFELQERTKCGPEFIANAIRDGSWHVQHVTETLRIGLIGGGQTPAIAANLVRRYVKEIPNWLDNKMIAHAALALALVGHETDDQEDEDEGEGEEPEPGKPKAQTAPTTDDGTGKTSTERPE